jgi:hypothetical protein
MILVATVGLIVAGCSTQKDPALNTSADSTGGDKQRHSDDDHALIADDKAELEAALAKLSPADRQLAQEQKICPVSGEPLGSMGAPIKVTVEGREVFVCCEGCVDEIKKNFDKYTAKLENTPGQ